MGIKNKKDYRRFRIKKRIRKTVIGTSERPRMSVFRSNKDIYIQLIDDSKGETLMSASSRDASIIDKKQPKIEKAKLVGKLFAEKAIEAGITSVVFDRNGYLFHGRVKALADSAKEAGLKI